MDWEERFEIEFGGVLMPGYNEKGYVDYSRVKAFIRDLLDEQERELRAQN